MCIYNYIRFKNLTSKKGNSPLKMSDNKNVLYTMYFSVCDACYKTAKQFFLCFFFLLARRPCPLLALLVNPRLQGLCPLQPMLTKSHLFLANIEQDPNTFCLYAISRKKKMRAANIYLGTFPLYRSKSRQMDFVMEDQLIGYNIVITYNITIHI